MSLIFEAVSSALDVSRDRVSHAFGKVEVAFDAARGELTRRVDAALSREGTSESRADEIVSIAQDFLNRAREMKAELLLLVSGSAGAWGAGLFAAGVVIAGATSASALGLIALVLGVLLIRLSGQTAMMATRELCSRISAAVKTLGLEF